MNFLKRRLIANDKEPSAFAEYRITPQVLNSMPDAGPFDINPEFA